MRNRSCGQCSSTGNKPFDWALRQRVRCADRGFSVGSYLLSGQSFVSAGPLSPAYVRSTTCHHLTGGTRGTVPRTSHILHVRNKQMLLLITALHAMQTRSSDEKSVRPSGRSSVIRVYCDKTVERSVQIYIPYEIAFSLVLWEEEWLVGATLSTWNFGSTDPHGSKIADFQPIFARSSSAVTSSEKSSIDANRKSTTRFPLSLRWSSYVARKSPKGGLKNAKRTISVKKIHFV